MSGTRRPGGRAAEPRSRRGLAVDERATRDVVRMRRRLHGVEDRRDARVGAVEHGAPLVAGAGPEDLRQARLLRRPQRAVALLGEVGVVPQAEPVEERGVELWLD